MKKVSELSTLCGIDACAIIYSPYESQPEVWPNALGVQRVIAQFKRMPEMEQSKKMVNQESFIRQRIAKANEQLKKQHKENREKEMTEVMYQCLTGKGLQNMVMADLNDLGWLLDQKLKEIYKRMEALKKMASQQQVAPPPPPPAAAVAVAPSAVAAATSEMMARGSSVQVQEQKPSVDLAMDGVQRPLWFTDWMNNPSDQNMGFGNGDEMIMPFHDNHNPMWSSVFFP